MAVKPMELGFQLTRFSEGNVKRLLRRGDAEKRYGDLKWLPTKDKRITLAYTMEGRGQNADLNFFVYLDGKCVGNVTFNYYDSPYEIRPLFKGRKVAVPHVAFLPAMRGLGYPSMIYGLALKKGTVLVSDHHTKDAAGLWEAVARKYKAKVAYTSEANDWKLSATSVNEDDWKVMYL